MDHLQEWEDFMEPDIALKLHLVTLIIPQGFSSNYEGQTLGMSLSITVNKTKLICFR